METQAEDVQDHAVAFDDPERLDEGDDDVDDDALGDGLVDREMSTLEDIRGDFEGVRTLVGDGKNVFEINVVREPRVVADIERVP